MKRLSSLAYRNLKRHRVRTVLTAAGIAIAALTLFSILSFNTGYDKALREDISESGIHLYVSRQGCPLQAATLLVRGGEVPDYVDEELLPRIKDVAGVKEAGGFLIGTAVTEGRADLFYGITPEGARLKRNWRVDGGWFENDGSIVLGSEVAATMGAGPGERVRIESVDEEFLVTGILEKTNSGEDNFIYLPLASAQRLFGKQGKLTAVSVRLNDVTELDPVKSEIEKLPGAYVIPADEMTEMILEIVGGTRSIMLAIVVIVLVLSGLGVFNTVLMATFERRGEFGYMRCMGARRTHIFRLVLMETLFICAAGLAAGILAGFASSGLIDGWIRSFLAYVPSGRLLRPDPAAVLISAAVLLFMGLAAGVYPGHRASKVSPMEAVRYEQ